MAVELSFAWKRTKCLQEKQLWNGEKDEMHENIIAIANVTYV